MRNKGRVYGLLCTGQYSVIQITKILHIADPRSVIRDLRKSGVNVSDVWRKTKQGARYKLYFIKNIDR